MKKFRFIIILVLIIGFSIFNYFALIPLNLRYTQTFFLFLAFLAILVALFLNVKDLFNLQEVFVDGQRITRLQSKGLSRYLKFISVLVVLLVIHIFSSSPILFAKQYQTLIGDIEEKDFNTDFSAVDIDQLPVVDHELAQSLGDKKLGTIRGLGSEYHVGEFTDIVLKGRMVLVAPLEYNDFFKWLNNSSKGTPGYIVVDKVSGDVEFVQEVNGKKLGLKYLPSAYFNQNIHRHTYFNGNMDNQIFKYSFELDEEGNPFWIAVKTHKTIGINGGDDVLSVVTIDAQTGDVNEYSPSEAPAWIDMIYPSELVLKQINDWGLYVDGFFNTLFAQKNVVLTTQGSRRVLNDGSVYHYTGLTSAGADESTVGFTFTNTRTKQTKLYSITGATEQAAMASAEGKVQNLRYRATFPIPLNIGGEPTFFITLKDAKGLIKQYAFVNINDYSIVSNGETIERAYQQYLNLVGKENTIPNENQTKTITGTISRIGSSVIEGTTQYYVVLEGVDGLYYGNGSVSGEFAVSKEGDSVSLKVQGLKIYGFDNLNVK